MRTRVLLLFIFAVVSDAQMFSQTQPTAPKADTIYVHANIYTGVTGGSSFHEGNHK